MVRKETITCTVGTKSNDRTLNGISDTDIDLAPENTDSFDSSAEISTTHTQRKLKLAEKWKELRNRATTAVVEGSCLPSSCICCQCGTKTADIRCLQCGPSAYFCSSCIVTTHRASLFHHYPEVWKVIPVKQVVMCVYTSNLLL